MLFGKKNKDIAAAALVAAAPPSATCVAAASHGTKAAAVCGGSHAAAAAGPNRCVIHTKSRQNAWEPGNLWLWSCCAKADPTMFLILILILI